MPPAFTQRAGETALLWGENALLELLVRLKENRDYCVAQLSKMRGITCSQTGRRILFVSQNLQRFPTSFDFCKRLLLETRVRLGARHSLRGRWRRIGTNLLRRRSSNS